MGFPFSFFAELLTPAIFRESHDRRPSCATQTLSAPTYRMMSVKTKSDRECGPPMNGHVLMKHNRISNLRTSPMPSHTGIAFFPKSNVSNFEPRVVSLGIRAPELSSRDLAHLMYFLAIRIFNFLQHAVLRPKIFERRSFSSFPTVRSAACNSVDILFLCTSNTLLNAITYAMEPECSASCHPPSG